MYLEINDIIHSLHSGIDSTLCVCVCVSGEGYTIEYVCVCVCEYLTHIHYIVTTVSDVTPRS